MESDPNEAGKIVLPPAEGKSFTADEFLKQIGFTDTGTLWLMISIWSLIVLTVASIVASLWGYFLVNKLLVANISHLLVPAHSLTGMYVAFSVVWFALTALLTTCFLKVLAALVSEFRLANGRVFVLRTLLGVIREHSLKLDTFVGEVARQSLAQPYAKEVASENVIPASGVLLEKIGETLNGILVVLKAKF